MKVWQLGRAGRASLKLLGESEPSDADGKYQVDASVGVRHLLLEVEGSQGRGHRGFAALSRAFEWCNRVESR